MKEQVAKQKEGIQHNLIKNQLLKKQQELLEQQELERKQQDLTKRKKRLPTIPENKPWAPPGFNSLVNLEFEFSIQPKFLWSLE